MSHYSLYATASAAIWCLVELPVLDKVLVDSLETTSRKELLPDDLIGFCLSKFNILRHLEQNCHLQRLLREPKSIHVFGSFEHLAYTGIIRGHQLEQTQHGHAMIAVGKVRGVIAARPVYASSYFFQPVLKLIGKEQVGKKMVKWYDEAATPYQRVLSSKQVDLY